MYYDNKLVFYIKQYSTHIIVGIICLMIIASGFVLYGKINNKNKEAQVNVSADVNQGTDTQNVTTDENTLLSDELKTLKAGEKAVVKIATIDDKGVMVILSGDKRINAKMIGVDFSEELPDTLYNIDKDICGKDIEISFDENKISLDGYAMVYVYADKTTLYNAKLLKEGKLVLDSSVSKKALEYNKLAESQAFAKQTLAGVWGE